jgi:hypothetical protein
MYRYPLDTRPYTYIVYYTVQFIAHPCFTAAAKTAMGAIKGQARGHLTSKKLLLRCKCNINIAFLSYDI